jgi:uncharacterized protein (TIGR03435 family)
MGYARTASKLCAPIVAAFVFCLASNPQSAMPPTFEVASIKKLDVPLRMMLPNRSGGSIHWDTDRALLIRYAFHMQRWRVSGMDTDDSYYQIDARTDPAATEDQVRLMFQALLVERFKLAVHRETRQVNGYVLTIGKGGPKIKPVADDVKAPPLPDYFGYMPTDAIPDGRILTTVEGAGTLALTGRRVTVAQIAEELQNPLRAFVLDKTGLPGRYYVSLKFANPEHDTGDDVASLTAALQEEFGLKLEKQKGPVEMLVVDHIDAVPVGN